MKPYEISESDLLISDDKARLDRPLIHAFLSGRSYWAKDVPVEIVERSIEHSLCFGTRDAHTLYEQYGFGPLKYPERFMEIQGENSYKLGS
jgi:hypothetical protein